MGQYIGTQDTICTAMRQVCVMGTRGYSHHSYFPPTQTVEARHAHTEAT